MAKRVDANQPEIVAALRKVGASVQHLHEVGDGCPDVLCGFRGQNYVIEIKTEKGKLNAREQKWHDEWNGQKDVARTPEEALRVIGAIE